MDGGEVAWQNAATSARKLHDRPRFVQLHFAVPPPSEVHAGFVETRPEQVAAWLDRVAGEPEDEALAAVHAAMSSLNRVALGDTPRFDLTERYRESLVGLVARARARLVAAALPLQPGLFALGEHARGALAELALSYRMMLNHHAAQRTPAKRQGVRLLRRAQVTMAGQALLCYETYTPLPEDYWRDFHRLYGYARYLGADRDAPDMAESPALLYRIGLLLALAEPYRMASGEAGRTLDLIRPLAARARLGESKGNAPRGQLVVEIGSDTPFQARGSRPKGFSGDLLLDTEPVRTALDMLLMRVRAGDTERSSRENDPELILRLVERFSLPGKRRYLRYDGQGSSAGLFAGLQGLSRRLAAHHANKPPSHGRLAGGADVEIHTPLQDAAAGVLAGRFANRWQVLNVSAEGLALQGRELAPATLRVGEVVGISHASEHSISLGLVRWMHAGGPNGLDIGVQWIAPHALAVNILLDAGGEWPGLLVPACREIRLPSLLVVPRGIWNAPGTLHLRGLEASSVREVETVRRVERTSSVEILQLAD